MSTPPKKLIYEFGSFRLDTEKQRLLSGSEIVSITPKAVETLRVLIERRGQLVERDDLMSSVWGDVAVEEGNLTVTISMLRKVLGDGTEGRKFIETVPRRGYKFVAVARAIFEDVPALIVEKETVGRVVIDEEFSLGKISSQFISIPHKKVLTATVTIIAVGLAIGALVYSLRSNAERSQATGVKSIAVLPFKLIKTSDKNDHQGLGLADVLITRLSNVKAINVRPTSAVSSFEDSQESSTTIGQKLLVDAVLEGSILQINDRVRVTARLIRVSDQSSIWAGQFEKSATDQLKLQDEIALQVVDALSLNLNRNEERALNKRYTENLDAYQLYSRGRYQWNKRHSKDLSEAERLFRNAIDKDPNFALAYVGLADSLMFADNSTELRSAISKALALDPNLAEAWASYGFYLSLHEWRWKEAEEDFKKSIELNPGYATAHHWYAILLGIEGRNEEAKAQLRRALEIDPQSYNFLADLGQVYYFNREYDKAEEYCKRALAIYPTFTFAHSYLYMIYLQMGKYEAAINELAKAETFEFLNSDDPEAVEQLRLRKFPQYAEPYQTGGPKKFLEYRVAQSKSSNFTLRSANAPYEDAINYALLGNKDRALESLERAFDRRAFMMAWVKAEPAFDSLRRDPLFKVILQKMNLHPDP